MKGKLPIYNCQNKIPESFEPEDEKFEACDNPILMCKKFIQDRLPRFRSTEERTRLYHVWPGKNVFFLSGRLVCGPDPKGFLLTSVSVFLSSWIFCVYIGNDFDKNSGLIVAFDMVLTIIVFVNLFMVSAIDPGIIPRNNEIPDVRNNELIRSKKVRIDGVEMKLKFCRVCKLFRPPRSCHCIVCDNCVDKFDHHCPWIGQCIGLRNYRFYLMFVLSALVFFTYIFSLSCQRINLKMSETRAGLFRTWGNSPETLALASFSFVAMVFLGGLASFHTYLIMLNQTAYENHRECYITSPNPYDKGIFQNVKEVLFTRLPPSRVNFQAELTLENCDPID
ncbi:protein S-acyltransferase [Ranunculus cassubicifolius]